MFAMTTPKKKRQRQRKGKALNVWIDAEIRDALDTAVERTRPRSSLRAVVEMVLGDWLRQEGLLPPPAK